MYKKKIKKVDKMCVYNIRFNGKCKQNIQKTKSTKYKIKIHIKAN